ncbi:MAG: hypothetical protein QW084_04105 [Candidatus Hadarchaeales archaeon]
MGTLKVDVEDKLLEQFKKKVKLYGYKGSLKTATEKLLRNWLQVKKADWRSLRGKLRLRGSPVEVQHRLWKKVD